MMKSTAIFFLFILISCSNTDYDYVTIEVENSINSLKKEIRFDKRENILEWEIDYSKKDTPILRVKTTYTNISKDIKKISQLYMLDYSIILLPEKSLSKTKYGIVNQSVASMRVENSRTSAMATQVLMGSVLKLLDKKGDWYLAKNSQNYIAWIHKKSFELLNNEKLNFMRNSNKTMLIVPSSYAYDENNNVVSDLVFGNVFILFKKGNAWSDIILPGDRIAKVKTKDIIDLKSWQKNTCFNKSNLINFAYKFMGQPYLWGGSSFKGIDCSGLSSAIYYSMGVFLPRDTGQQIKEGDDVIFDKNKQNGFKNLEIGDLLFFKENNKVYHVAIWLGDNTFIHSSGKVHLSSFDKNSILFDEILFNNITNVKRINNSKSLSNTIDLKKTSIWL